MLIESIICVFEMYVFDVDWEVVVVEFFLVEFGVFVVLIVMINVWNGVGVFMYVWV